MCVDKDRSLDRIIWGAQLDTCLEIYTSPPLIAACKLSSERERRHVSPPEFSMTTQILLGWWDTESSTPGFMN